MKAKSTKSCERNIGDDEEFLELQREPEEDLSDNTSQNSFEILPQLPRFSTQAARRNLILVSVDGIQSGVPTLTTSTLTPTTLRSIEETFTQLISEPINAPYQAGFIPPPLAPFTSSAIASGASSSSTPLPVTIGNNFKNFNEDYDSEADDSQMSWNAAHINDNSMETTDTSSAATDSISNSNGNNGHNSSMITSITSSKNESFSSGNIQIHNTSAPYSKDASDSVRASNPRRNQGGRRPMKSANLTPEEEEKRRVRRERNKLAAARCRKRRVDQTNELLEEVAILERKREGLQKDIENLNATKQELEYVLEAHKPTCQKIHQNLLSVATFGGLVVPTTNTSEINTNKKITLDRNATLPPSRSHSPIDLKPLTGNVIDVVQNIKDEPVDDNMLDTSSQFDQDGSRSPKRILLTRNNPMIPPSLPNMATLSPALAANSVSLNTPIITTTPLSFCYFNNTAALNAISTINKTTTTVPANNCGSKQRPNTLPNVPRNQAQKLDITLDSKPPTDINGIAIQTPSAGMFNFESLMDGGTGLTPVSGPLVPTCSSQNKTPHELPTPTSEPSKLVSL